MESVLRGIAAASFNQNNNLRKQIGNRKRCRAKMTSDGMSALVSLARQKRYGVREELFLAVDDDLAQVGAVQHHVQRLFDVTQRQSDTMRSRPSCFQLSSTNFAPSSKSCWLYRRLPTRVISLKETLPMMKG